MTREELKEKLASKENKLAKKLIDLLTSQCDDKLEKVKELINLGAPNVFYLRDPQHPRSKYRIEHVLDYLFLSPQVVTNACSDIPTTEQDQATEDENIKIFETLLESNFSGGLNSARGCLYSHILNNCFYTARTSNEEYKKRYSIRLAKVLVKHNKVDTNTYASGSYLWSNCLENLSTLLELGANPKGHQLIDSAISYVTCSSESKNDPKARLKVIDKLLSLGATAKRPLQERVGNNDIAKELCQWGIVGQIEYQIQSYKLKEALKI